MNENSIDFKSEKKKKSKIEKHDNFVRLVEARVKKALKYMQLIGNLANKRNYDYSTDEVDKIIHSLEKGLERLKMKFEPDNINFSL